MQTSLPSLFALTFGTLLMTMPGPVMAQNFTINPAQPAAGQPAAAAPAGAAAVAPAAAQAAPVAATTTTVAQQTGVATTGTTTVQSQVTSLPASTVLGNFLNANQPFGMNMPGFGGRSRCGNVIQMLMQQHMQSQLFGGNAPAVQSPAFTAFDPFGRPVALSRLGDLKLISIDMITDATADVAPLYEVTILNDSPRVAEDFRVTLVAVHGSIFPTSPTVTVNVDEIAAGGTATLQVQMPVQCLSIAVAGQAAVAFDTVVVAIDSFNELMEENELNNVAVLQRSAIVIEGTTETAVTTETVQSTTTAVAPAAPADAPAATGPAATAPVDNAAPAPNNGGAAAPSDGDDKLNFDNLGLDDADEAESTFYTGE